MDERIDKYFEADFPSVCVPEPHQAIVKDLVMSLAGKNISLGAAEAILTEAKEVLKWCITI